MHTQLRRERLQFDFRNKKIIYSGVWAV